MAFPTTHNLSDLNALWLETCEKLSNERDQLRNFADELVSVSGILEELPKTLKKSVMVPFSPIAFFPGEIVHTNEVMVLLGENYFSKCTAPNARGILDRRVKYLEENITTLETQIQQFRSKIDMNLALKKETEGEDLVEIMEEYHSEEEEEEGVVGMEHLQRKDKEDDEDDLEERRREEYLQRLMELEEEEESAMTDDYDDEEGEEGEYEDDEELEDEELLKELEKLQFKKSREEKRDEQQKVRNDPTTITNPSQLYERYLQTSKTTEEKPVPPVVPNPTILKPQIQLASVSSALERFGSLVLPPREEVEKKDKKVKFEDEQTEKVEIPVSDVVLERSSTFDSSQSEEPPKKMSRFKQQMAQKR